MGICYCLFDVIMKKSDVTRNLYADCVILLGIDPHRKDPHAGCGPYAGLRIFKVTRIANLDSRLLRYARSSSPLDIKY